jgi:hypothetical protein
MKYMRINQALAAAVLAAFAAVGPAAAQLARSPVSRAGGVPSLWLVQDKKEAAPVYKIGPLVIEGPWARATPGGARVAGGYLKITNSGSAPDWLVGGSLALASEVEIHEMAMSNNVMKMRRLDKGLEIRPGQTVELKPGGHHVMFVGLSAGLKAGEPVKGSLRFEKAGVIEVEFRVAPIGAPSGGGGHHRH